MPPPRRAPTRRCLVLPRPSVCFQAKSKRLKKIKSKEYRRKLKKAGGCWAFLEGLRKWVPLFEDQ